MRRALLITPGMLLLLAAVLFFTLSPVVAARMNPVQTPPPYRVSEPARALHQRLFVADLHNDLLLWDRDPLARGTRGHSDLPRLLEGGVGLQVFTAVTQVPSGQNATHNRADSDRLTALVMAQRWPPRTWGSRLERALYQADRLHQAAAASGGQLRVVRSRADLSATPPAARGQLLAVLGVEGMHAAEGQLAHIDRLHDAGFRAMGLVHFFDNEVGGSAHGAEQGGLTAFGRQALAHMQQKGMLVDLAHASPRLFDDVLAATKKPVMVSHTGVQATCPGPRNLSDAQLRAVAANGGVVGIAFFRGAVCGTSVAHIVRAIRHAVQVAGVRHVALGSDFDGAVRTEFDATGLPLITQGLLQAGFSEADIAAIMGGNVLRLLRETLPAD
ncbi:MAG: dipeptidase [Pseudomonadota bacterium]|nr:dipeptidase [Pseudomonadota bacterium]